MASRKLKKHDWIPKSFACFPVENTVEIELYLCLRNTLTKQATICSGVVFI